MADRNVPRHRPYEEGRWESQVVSADSTTRKPHSHHYRPYQPPPPRHRAPSEPARRAEPERKPERARRAPREVAPGKVGRRSALLALGTLIAGTAATRTQQGGRVVDWVLGRSQTAGGGAGTGAGIVPDRPSGQQPSTVRTYTEQNESYMGSKAGDALKKNAPAGGRRFSSPAIAANATKVTVDTVLSNDPARHLASRLTFGPTPKVIAEINQLGIDEWIEVQLAPERIAETPAEKKLAELTTLGMTIPQLRAARADLESKGIRADEQAVQATIARQIWSDRQLFEVMVAFWNDFLHVPAFYEGSQVQRASFDRDVIRRYALDNYPDMLVAANQHPALLTYLGQSASTKDRVNENLARENLEQFSVGVDGGYTENDVRQAALLQTGHGVKDDQYAYRSGDHHVGPVKIMGFSHPNGSAAGGERAAEEYLRFLASHPATARAIAASLATRFVSDTPPKSLVDRLAKSYTVNRGRIKPVLMELLSSSEFWASVGQKVRRPLEYVVATYRALGVSPETPAGYQPGPDSGGRTPFVDGLRQLQQKLEELGQYPMGSPTPGGYPDVFVAWTSAGSIVNCWNEAGDAIVGRRSMFTYVKPEQLAGATPATAGPYLEALTKRLVFQSISIRERVLILGIAGLTPDTPVDPTLNGAIVPIARAILASPQHHLR
ncbi:DUF1800 domain-containing protein [Phytohabitans aurantiacus]|jgi:uncharacterized protein (DUF1800 family)|uniref:DUF1800 domain-containing protein n=1 Tax=Phytohabitans aurantiacus TaxID=3016789 RepID=A0ABQ5R8D1_9ACTN|nr:DUF1800 domain-containing protein [Phytohabitans aurantiacus]GLI03017.1 hypothetical protein Pa4123_82950 [Phytohabitans aurantiacus]